MLIDEILKNCDKRHIPYKSATRDTCEGCSYGTDFCPKNCEKCLDFIHFREHSPSGSPSRKYDCQHMADFYTCKYSCRYTSEMIYAFKRLKDIQDMEHLKILSFGCGPCTDLFAIDYLKENKIINYKSVDFIGIDYAENVWKNIHSDIEIEAKKRGINAGFGYVDMCEAINIIRSDDFVPNVVTFQYVFSDMQKHTGEVKTRGFIKGLAEFASDKLLPNSYIVMNDINLTISHGGGLDYFDEFRRLLEGFYIHRKGRFARRDGRQAFRYGQDSDDEFPTNKIFFDLSPWSDYNPFDLCESAQMLIKKS